MRVADARRGVTRRVDRRLACGALVGAMAIGGALWRLAGPGAVAETQTLPVAEVTPGEPRQVVHTVFVNSSGPATALSEARQETWSLLGPDGGVLQSRVRVTDSSGRLDQEGFSDGGRGLTVNVQFVADRFATPDPRHPQELITTSPRPRSQPAVMWTAAAVRQQLEGTGFRAVGDVTVASLLGTRYEKREAFAAGSASGADPNDVYPIPAEQIAALVRQSFVGRSPAGTDLGEEAGYVDQAGQFSPVLYRRLALYELLDQAPPDTFDWPYGFAPRLPTTVPMPWPPYAAPFEEPSPDRRW